MLALVVEHHPHGPLPHLGGIRSRLLHGPNLSSVGASDNPGAIQTVALERRLAAGDRLPTDATMAVVNSVLDRILEVGLHNQQVQSLPVRLLRVLPFLED